jgi:hypothetical protein
MSVLQAIGRTPLVEIRNSLPTGIKSRIFAKLEGTNPGGSVKDRAALYLLENAEKQGLLKPGMTIIEATSRRPDRRSGSRRQAELTHSWPVSEQAEPSSEPACI